MAGSAQIWRTCRCCSSSWTDVGPLWTRSLSFDLLILFCCWFLSFFIALIICCLFRCFHVCWLSDRLSVLQQTRLSFCLLVPCYFSCDSTFKLNSASFIQRLLRSNLSPGALQKPRTNKQAAVAGKKPGSGPASRSSQTQHGSCTGPARVQHGSVGEFTTTIQMKLDILVSRVILI